MHAHTGRLCAALPHCISSVRHAAHTVQGLRSAHRHGSTKWCGPSNTSDVNRKTLSQPQLMAAFGTKVLRTLGLCRCPAGVAMMATLAVTVHAQRKSRHASSAMHKPASTHPHSLPNPESSPLSAHARCTMVRKGGLALLPGTNAGAKAGEA